MDLTKRAHDGDYRSADNITLGDYMLKRWLPTKRSSAQDADHPT